MSTTITPQPFALSTYFFLLIGLLLLAVSPSAWAISPSQVLVLYNADWRKDHPLTQPGQDSKEIADYYVRMHTNPKTGEKPSQLGLSCRHGATHLNKVHLAERSSDNQAGVQLTTLKRQISGTETMRDSRLVEFVLPGQPQDWDMDTLTLELGPKHAKLKDRRTIIKNGANQFPAKVQFQPQGEWHVRLNGKAFFQGSFTAWATCRDASGERYDWSAEYKDIDEVACTRTGPDGTRDDMHFLEDVARPIKQFLEDPKNARPDGTLLKDHILYIVVSYGLPRTARATFGIARGISQRWNDFGTDIAFEQRLQLLDYDLEKVLGFKPRPHRFTSQSPFSAYYLRAPQAWPLFGEKANPFVHPQVYAKDKGPFEALADPLPFTAANRNKLKSRRLYFAMRIDGKNPLQAKALIDRASYFSRYGSPRLGQMPGMEYPMDTKRVGYLERKPVGQWLWDKGFRHLYYGGQGKHLIELFHLPPEEGFWNQEPVFLPGAVAGTVISNNGWKGDSFLDRDLNMGTSAAIGVARVYGGAPHIHSKSWWDDEILYPSLLQHRTIGECFLMNQVHLGWIASFVGDPLMRLPEKPFKDDRKPECTRVRLEEIKNRDEKSGRQLWIRAKLDASPKSPEVAQMRVVSVQSGREVGLCQTFEASPYATITRDDEDHGPLLLEFIDPTGNTSEIIYE